MRASLVTKLGGLFAALLLASAAFSAPPSRDRDASELLSQLHQDALQVRDSAAEMEANNRQPFLVDWRMNADTLEGMRAEINQMDQLVYRLHAVEETLPRNEQAEINEITPAMVELTDTAQLAINFVRNHEDRVWTPKYTAYADEMYSEANRIDQQTAGHSMKPLAGAKANPSSATSSSSNGS